MPGQNIQYLVSITADIAGAKRAETALRRLKRSHQGVIGVQKRGSVASKSMGNDLSRLAGRAALTIPIWFALRGTFTALFNVMRDGGARIVDLSRALTKASVTISGTVDDLDGVLLNVADQATELAQRFGVAVPKVVSSFQKFATSGLDVETSLAGMNASIKLSTILQGDLVKVSDALAGAYKLLGDTTEQNLSVQQRLNLVAAKIVTQWKDNRFEIDGLAQSFNNFLSTAKVANITLDESIVLLTTLSTAGLLSGKGGRLLRTTFLNFQGNLKAVRNELGLLVTESDRVFDSFIQALNKISEIQKSGQTFRAENLVKQLFGGIRGGLPAKSLLALIDELNAGLARISTEGGKNQEAIRRLFQTLNRELKISEASIALQVDRFKELNIQIGQAFLIGVTGGDSFGESLKRINESLAKGIVLAEQFGSLLRLPFEAAATAGSNIGNALGKINDELSRETQSLLKAGLTGNLRENDLNLLIKRLEIIKASREKGETGFPLFEAQLGGLAIDPLLRNLIKVRDEGITLKFAVDASEQDRQLIDNTVELQKVTITGGTAESKEPEAVSRISVSQRILLRSLADQLQIINMQVQGVDQLVTAQQEFSNIISQVADKTNEVGRLNGLNVDLISESELEVAAMAKDWEEILRILQNSVSAQEDFKVIAQAIVKFDTQILEKERAIALQRSQLAGLDRQVELQQLQAAGIDDMTIAQIEFRNRVQEVVDAYNDTIALQDDQIERLDAAELHTALIAGNWDKVNDLLKDVADSEERVVELARDAVELMKKQAQELANITKGLKNDLKDAISGALRGEENLFDALKNRMRDQLIDAISEGIAGSVTQTGLLTDLSKVLGTISGKVPAGQAQAGTSAGQAVNSAIVSGGQTAAQAMQQGIQTGGQNAGTSMAQILSRALGGVGGAGGTGGGGGLLQGILGNLGGLGGAARVTTSQGISLPASAVSGGGGLLSGIGGALTSLPGIGGALGGIGGGIAAIAAPLLGILGPIGLIAGIGFGIAGIIKGLKSKTTSETRTQQFQTASRIDVTNRKLDIVNRNLVALKSTIETFILPESAFFTESRGTLEDVFSLNARRGLSR